MAVTHTETVNATDYGFDFTDQEIEVEAGVLSSTAADIKTAIRNAEASVVGIVWPDIVDTANPVTLTATTDTFQVNKLLDMWKILSLSTSGTYTVEDGNTVSDADGIDIFAANTQVTLVNNTSAAGVLVQSAKIDDLHGQVRRAIFINTEALTNGNGYQQTPYDNWTDAVDAAEAQNLQTLYLEADATVDRQLKNFEILGIDLPQIDLNSQIMDNTIIRECEVTGTQGTSTTDLLLLTCAMVNVSDFRGSALTVSMFGTISFQNGANVLINNIVPAVAGSTITIDMNGGVSSTVTLQNASGSYNVTNMDQVGDTLHMNMTAGTVTIDATCTAGTLVIAGNCNVIDNSAGTTVTTTALVEPEEVHEIHQDMGLNSSNAVTITENTADTSYDQTSTGITKEIRTSGTTKTITRT